MCIKRPDLSETSYLASDGLASAIHPFHLPNTAAKGCPYRLDGSRRLDSTLLILPIDGREGYAANFSIFLKQHCHLEIIAEHKVTVKQVSSRAPK